MSLLSRLKKIIMMPTWEPKHNIVYKSWTKTPFFRSNERIVSVGNKWCEIRVGN